MFFLSADLGATTKPWVMQTKVARLVAEEFWEQGDLERQLGKEPDEMMRRELQHKLAFNQVGFLDFVCLPVYRALSALSPALKPMEEAAASNRQRYKQQNSKTAKQNKRCIGVDIVPKMLVNALCLTIRV